MRHSPMTCPPGSRLPAWSPRCCHALTRPNQFNQQRKCEMSETLIWTDRLSIERRVWTLNTYLQTLPRRSQLAKRRELRVNLRAASADVGTKEALRRLGNVRTMAADYINAEYGGPRPSWWAAICVFPAFWVMFWWSSSRIDAFKGGVIAANPHATGLFHWHGVTNVFTDATFTF